MNQGEGESKSLQAVFTGGVIEFLWGVGKRVKLAFCQPTK